MSMAQALEDDSLSGDDQRRVVFESAEELRRVFSSPAIDLLRAITQENPESVREAAQLVDHDAESVSKDLSRLERYEVIDYKTDGESERPVVLFDDIQIHLGPT